jgi:hypothetical protein
MDIETPIQQTLREGPVSQRLIEPLQLYDPLLVLLKVKLRLNNWWIITAMGILFAAGWHLTDLLTSFQLLLVSVNNLFWMGFYLFLPSTIADLFNQLWENGSIGNSRTDTPGSISYKEFVEKQARWIRSRWWGAIALFVLTLTWIFFFVDPIMNIPLWWRPIAILVGSVCGYMGCLSLAWLVMMGVATNELFHVFTIRVRPLHPDGSGGLGLFNRLLWISTTLVIIAGCSALVGQGGNRVFIFVISYLIIAALLLRAWLVLPHQAMVQARNKLLQPLTNEYERALSETTSGAMGDTAAINEGTGRLTALQKRYEQVRNSFPTWPIEIAQLRGLVTLLILPVLFALLPLLIDMFRKK